MATFLKQPLTMMMIAVFCGACGQVLIKTGVNERGKTEGLVGLLGMFTQPKVFGGFAFYGVSSLLYLKVLEKLPLSYVYPMIAANFVIVTVLSYIFFKEVIPPLRMFGLALICLGVICVSRSSR